MIMSRYIDVDKKIEEINMRIESTTRLIENRPYDEEAKLILREHKFCLKELERTPIAVVEEVIFCANCNYYKIDEYYCKKYGCTMKCDDFCSYGDTQ